MSYTVTLKSNISLTDAIGATRTEFNLPLTEIRATNNAQYPNTLTTLIAESSAKTFDLTYLGSQLKAFAFKSTRPVAVFLITADKEYELPLSTYASFVVDSKESVLAQVTGVRVEVGAASVTSISPQPANYPNAFVELFILMLPAA